MGVLVKRPDTIDLTKSHIGPQRVFFVGENWWRQVNRITSRRPGNIRVKVHVRWTFVQLRNCPDPMMLIEVPLINIFMEYKYGTDLLLLPRILQRLKERRTRRVGGPLDEQRHGTTDSGVSTTRRGVDR